MCPSWERRSWLRAEDEKNSCSYFIDIKKKNEVIRSGVPTVGVTCCGHFVVVQLLLLEGNGVWSRWVTQACASGLCVRSVILAAFFVALVL